MSKTYRIGSSLAFITLLLAACELPPDQPDDDHVPPWGVYAEFLDVADVEATFTALAERDVSLTLAVQATAIGDETLAEHLRAARAARVDVRLWLLLETSAGYWPNETNIDLFATEVTRLLDWLEAEDLRVSGIVYDMEPAYDFAIEIRETDPFDTEAVDALFAPHLDEAAFQEARERLTASVTEVQSRGLRASCVTFPQVLDDLIDGDEDLQDALDIPVAGVPFDEVGLMVYQTTFGEMLGGWIGPSLITSFATDAVEQWGDRAVIALGIVGTVGIFGSELGYADAALLAADIEAARQVGIGRVEIYSLDGMVENGGVASWLDADPLPEPADSPPMATLVRIYVQELDARLDDL